MDTLQHSHLGCVGANITMNIVFEKLLGEQCLNDEIQKPDP